MLLNAVGFLSRSSMRMLLAISLFIMTHFPSVALAAPVCDDTNIGHKEIILPGGSISPGVDLPSPAGLVYGASDMFTLGILSPTHYNCHTTSGDYNFYDLYVFIEPLSSYGSSFILNVGRAQSAYSVTAINAPAFGVGFTNARSSPPGMAVTTLLTVTFNNSSAGENISNGYYYISLVNGSLLQPGVLTGSDLPTFGIYGMIYKKDGTPYDGKKISMGSISFSGSMNVIPFTCQTPDVVVPMGKYKMTDFTGVGSTSQWVDFNIELDNCPGNYPGYNNSMTKNNVSVLVNAVYGNPTPDSFRLKSGAGSAVGIDMQVRKKNDTSVLTMGTGFDPRIAFHPMGTAGNTGITRFRIPLQARYIQSGGQVTPGLAESALTFTINYY